jgi:hypothetical protein
MISLEMKMEEMELQKKKIALERDKVYKQSLEAIAPHMPIMISHTHTCIHACMHAYIHTRYTHTHTHTYTHTYMLLLTLTGLRQRLPDPCLSFLLFCLVPPSESNQFVLSCFSEQ